MDIFPMVLIRAGGLPLNLWEQWLCSPAPLPLPEGLEENNDRIQLALDEILRQLPDSGLRTRVYNSRKAFFQKRLLPDENLLDALAGPLQPTLCAELESALAHRSILLLSQAQFDADYSRRLHLERAGVAQLAERPEFQYGLLFSSHDLLHKLPGFIQKNTEEWDKKDRQTALSLLQYASRAIFKTSPFGKWTTVQPGRRGPLPADGIEINRNIASPNVGLLPAIYDWLLREKDFRNALHIRLNPALSLQSSRLQWIYFDGEREAVQSMEPDPTIGRLVELLQNTSVLYSELLEMLAAEIEADGATLEKWLEQLLDAGLLEWVWPEPGLSPSWSGRLYQFLGFLPASPEIHRVAFLLNWLKTQARTLPFLEVVAAQKAQLETKQTIDQMFRSSGMEIPPIPVEQVFFMDALSDHPSDCPFSALEEMANDLADCWKALPQCPLLPFHARLFHFARKALSDGQAVSFLEFCTLFLSDEAPEAEASVRIYRGQMGALLQVYRENGQYRAALNALFPGSGKMFARWMHLLPQDFQDQWSSWRDHEKVVFPWHGWTNANYQPSAARGLAYPGGRTEGHVDNFSLHDLVVAFDPEDGPLLVRKSDGRRVLFDDWGLEAPDTKPPLVQVLWHLGVPRVSAALLQRRAGWVDQALGIRRRRRSEFRSLVLSREAWEISPEYWKKYPEIAVIWKRRDFQMEESAMRYRLFCSALLELGVPKRFFLRTEPQHWKPQLVDMDSVLSMQLFEKMLAAGLAPVWIEEMLPTAEQWLLGASNDKRVGEWVVEFRV